MKSGVQRGGIAVVYHDPLSSTKYLMSQSSEFKCLYLKVEQSRDFADELSTLMINISFPKLG